MGSHAALTESSLGRPARHHGSRALARRHARGPSSAFSRNPADRTPSARRCTRVRADAGESPSIYARSGPPKCFLPTISEMGGRPMYKASDSRVVVPLLDPSKSGNDVPYAVALELLCLEGSACPSCEGRALPKETREDQDAARDVYELHYVLDGHGKMILQEEASVLPGDTLLLPPGATRRLVSLSPSEAAAVAAEAAAARGAPAEEPAADGDADPWWRGRYGMATLVVYMPTDLFDVENGGEHSLGGSVAEQRATEAARRAAARWYEGECVGELADSEVQAILSAHLLCAETWAADARRTGRAAADADGGAAGAGLWERAAAAFGRQFTVARDWFGVTRLTRVSSDGDASDGQGGSATPQVKPAPAPSPNLAPVVDPLESVRHRTLTDLASFSLPGQTNRLALAFDPLAEDHADRTPFTFGVEAFEKGHKTPPHLHARGHELFFILAGEGEAFCDGQRFPIGPGAMASFPPMSIHGIDVAEDSERGMYCLELMLPNDAFAEFVRSGESVGHFTDDDLCMLIAVGCGGAPGVEQGAAGQDLAESPS
ncbi:unnamed protein product [Pedinophyceae sp. YPF-701]|nr:unnamed protein product [Pedinophyceae sp. YPF-701]